MASSPITNHQRAIEAWGPDLPEWIKLLALHADRTSQRAVADRLGKSSPYVSRIINRSYAGNYQEAENQVRSIFGEERVPCPIFGQIALKTCIRSRRRTGPAVNFLHHQFAKHCPNCPINTDIGDAS